MKSQDTGSAEDKIETRGRKVEVVELGKTHDRVARLKHLRTCANMSQPQMAEKIGATFRTYCKIEAGERDLKADELAILLEHCGADANWFLFGTGSKEAKRK
ncbi:helix-turn-helix transcriptional regulator [Roseovarius aestuarii]|nr:helix-turn-helix transcriptional regulator [Roseovarius aestuarii]